MNENKITAREHCERYDAGLIVYAEIFAAVNFIMDFFTLYAVSAVLHIKKTPARRIAAALLGAVYSVVSLYVTLPEPFFAVIISVCMCAIAFWNGRVRVLMKALVLFYAAGMLLGGMMSFLYQTAYRLGKTSLFKNGLSPLHFFAFCGIIFALVFPVCRWLSGNLYTKTVTVKVHVGEKHRTLTLFVDTGNFLKDPFTGKDALVVRTKSLDGLFVEELTQQSLKTMPEEAARRLKIRLVPVNTVSGSALLIAFTPDRLLLVSPKGKQTPLDAVIALDPSPNADFSGTDGVIGQAAYCNAG